MTRVSAALAALAIIGNLGWGLLNDPKTPIDSLLGASFIIGISIIGVVESAYGCYIVLAAKDGELGKLAQMRATVALGLVIGFCFSVVTLLESLKVIDLVESQPTKSPNQAMERTPKALVHSFPLTRPFGPPVYVAAWQSASFSLGH